MMGPWMMQEYGFPFFGGGLMLFWLLLIVGSIVALTVWLARRTTTMPGANASGDAIAILKTRFAKGEITRDQFEEMKQAIGA